MPPTSPFSKDEFVLIGNSKNDGAGTDHWRMTRPDGQMTKVEINGTGQSSHLYATNNIAKKNKLTDSIPNRYTYPFYNKIA